MILATPPQRTAAPVIGYRCFRVGSFGRLLSATGGEEWSAELHEATCRGQGHAAPQRGCECGIHAFGSLKTTRRYAQRRWALWPMGLLRPVVIGAVRLYSGPGRPVIAGAIASGTGVRRRRDPQAVQYRAPYAQLVALLDSPSARRAGKRLGVPVVPETDSAGRPAFECFAREHGVQLEEAPTTTPAAVRRPVWAPSARQDELLQRLAAWVSLFVGSSVVLMLAGGLSLRLVAIVSYMAASTPIGWMAQRSPVRGRLARAVLAVVIGAAIVPAELGWPLLRLLASRLWAEARLAASATGGRVSAWRAAR